MPATAKRYALVIGVDDYQDPRISRLDGAAADAQTLASALVEYAGFPSQQVVLLATNQPADRHPTRGTLLRRLSNLRGTVPTDGLLVLAFAGHGIERNGKAYLLPSDAQVSDDVALLEDTAISVDSIRERITQTGVQQVILILDACRNDPTAGRGESDNVLTNAYTRQFNFDQSNRGITAHATLYATEVGHRAYEYKEKKQGYFTWALVEGLKGGAATANGNVTLGSLISYLQEVVETRVKLDLGATAQQRPFAVVSGYHADDLIIAVSKAPAVPAAVATAPAPKIVAPPVPPVTVAIADARNSTPVANAALPAKPADSPAPTKPGARVIKVIHKDGVLSEHSGNLEVADGSLKYHEEPPVHDFNILCKDFVGVRILSRIADPKQQSFTVQLKGDREYSFRAGGDTSRDQVVVLISSACAKR